MADLMSQDYRYVCEDRSVFLPYYKRFVWERALPWVPEQVSPNTLSILANVCSILAFATLLVLTPEQHYLFLFPAVATFLYLCLDNMDGMHARRTGQSSPLGEFLDHWFDAFNAGFLVFGLYYATRQEPGVILLLLAGTNLAYFATMWEQRRTGVIRFGRGGQVEGVTSIVVVYLGITLLGHDALCRSKLFGLITVAQLTAVFLTLGYAATIAGCLWRTRKGYAEWIPLVLVTGAALSWFHWGSVGFFPMAFLLLFSNSHFGGRHVIARVLNRSYNSRDPIFLGGVAAAPLLAWAAGLPPAYQNGLGWLLALYLLGRLGHDFWATVNALRHHFRPGELLARAFGGRKRPGRLH